MAIQDDPFVRIFAEDAAIEDEMPFPLTGRPKNSTVPSPRLVRMDRPERACLRVNTSARGRVTLTASVADEHPVRLDAHVGR